MTQKKKEDELHRARVHMQFCLSHVQVAARGRSVFSARTLSKRVAMAKRLRRRSSGN